jgi:hypothetical protein
MAGEAARNKRPVISTSTRADSAASNGAPFCACESKQSRYAPRFLPYLETPVPTPALNPA